MKSKITCLILVLLAAAFIFPACNTMVRYSQTATPDPGPAAAAKHPGPPPHAPAHGYRCKNSDGAQLVYDSNLAVYVVSGHSDYYFYNDRYYRWNKSSWQVSVSLDKGWSSASDKSVPPGLRKTHVSKGASKNKKGK